MTQQPLPPELATLVAAEAEAPPAVPASLQGLVDEWLVAKAAVDELEAALKGAKGTLDHLRKTLIPDKMRELGLVAGAHGSFTHDSGARVHLQVRTYASVKKELEEGLRAWLRAEGHADLIREVVYPQTLQAFVKERQEDGLTLPPGVSVYQETVAVLTQPKGASA